MSDIIVPKAQSLVFCKRYEVDPVAKEVNLRGVFHRLRFRSFPTEVVPFTVYSVLKDGLGEGEMRVTLYTWIEGEFRKVYWRREWFHFAGEPDTIELVVRFRELTFRFPGHYVAVLTFDGNLISKRPFQVEGDG